MKRIIATLLLLVILSSACGCRKIGSESSSSSDHSSDAILSSEIEYVETIEESESEKSSASKTEATNSKTSSKTSSKTGSSQATQSTQAGTLAPPVTEAASPQIKEPDIIDSSAPSVEVTPSVIEPAGDKPLAYFVLTDNQKKIYSLMSAAIDTLNDQNIKITDGTGSMSDVTVAYRAITFDRPEVFWLSSSYSMANDGSFFRLKYSCSSSEKASMLAQLNSKTKEIVSAVSGMSSRYEKVHYIHDWLCENVAYTNTPSNELIYSAYGALVNGKAVCEGYSRAMQLLCDELGIPCYLVYGASRGVPHMWNAVELESSWYQLDVTWDDDETNGYVRHSYLDVTEATMKADHVFSPMLSATTQYTGSDSFNFFNESCTATKMNYFYKNSLILTDDYKAAAEAVAKCPTKDKQYCELYIQNSFLAANFSENINEVLNDLNQQLSGFGITIRRYSVTPNSILISWKE